MSKSLAFVDVETTGLSPAEDRIAEIGVVAVDGDRVERWTTLVRTHSRRERTFPDGVNAAELANAPRFPDIARDLARRLFGRLLIAHNARFDHAFLKAEFDRAGVAFEPEVLCSVMLSRRLYPRLAHHDLDSLVASHGLCAGTRHRALPDADLVWQWWQAAHEDHSDETIGKAVASLLAGPVLPPQLDPSLIERLPMAPGAYVFHGEHDEPLVVAAAANLRLHVRNYFRVDQATSKALEYAHRIANISWRRTRGLLGAQLHAAKLESVLVDAAKQKIQSTPFTWTLTPETFPSVAVAALVPSRGPPPSDSFCCFSSERKARNALKRLASKRGLCHMLLGISGSGAGECPACPIDHPGAGCLASIDRKRHLMRLCAAIEPLRLSAWPHRGPVGIRERTDLHVIDQWQFLGTAQNESEVYALLENHQRPFDKRSRRLLERALARLPRNKIVDLSRYADSSECTAAVATDL
jgi:DNA polymerase-3 subunit epsilon